MYLPPVTVKQLLVEDCAIGTEKVNRIKVGWVNRILKWYNILDRNATLLQTPDKTITRVVTFQETRKSSAKSIISFPPTCRQTLYC